MSKTIEIYLYRRKGMPDYATCDRSRYIELSQHKLFDTMIAYTSPPAPVAVLLPERKRANDYAIRLGMGSYVSELAADEWNACLDKIKELNQ